MKDIFVSVRMPALIGLIAVLPFMYLEFTNRRSFSEGFPIPLFGILWFLPLVFFITLMPMIEKVRMGKKLFANPINGVLQVAFLILVAGLWVAILHDQMPCFLGVPYCD